MTDELSRVQAMSTDKRGRLLIEIDDSGDGPCYFGDLDSLRGAMAYLGQIVRAEIEEDRGEPIVITVTRVDLTDAEVDALPEL